MRNVNVIFFSFTSNCFNINRPDGLRRCVEASSIYTQRSIVPACCVDFPGDYRGSCFDQIMLFGCIDADA